MGRLHSDDPPAASSHSLHSLDNDDLPPPYTDEPDLNPTPAVGRPATTSRPLLLVDSTYVLPGTKGITICDKQAVTLAPELSRNSGELFSLIRRQIKLPLRPLLGVKGSHTESSNDGKKKNSNTVVDFQFQLDLAETMLTGWEGGPMSANWMEVAVIKDGDDIRAYRGGRLRSRTYKAPTSRHKVHLAEDSEVALLGPEADASTGAGVQRTRAVTSDDETALQLWCERFCNDPAAVKSFTLHRELRGFDYSHMRNVLASHIRSLNYRGSTTFWFTKGHSSVTVYSPHWINRLRINEFIWWICVILQLWIITWPLIWLMEKRYEVAQTRWNASLDPGSETGILKCWAFGRDESALAEFWAPAVKQAAWTRRQGEAALLTRLDAERLQGLGTEQLLGLEGSPESDAERERRERVNRGEGGFVDNVVGLVRGVSEVRQDWRLGMGWGADS